MPGRSRSVKIFKNSVYVTVGFPKATPFLMRLYQPCVGYQTTAVLVPAELRRVPPGYCQSAWGPTVWESVISELVQPSKSSTLKT